LPYSGDSRSIFKDLLLVRARIRMDSWNLFFDSLDLLSETHHFKEKKDVAILDELTYLLGNNFLTDSISNLFEHLC